MVPHYCIFGVSRGRAFEEGPRPVTCCKQVLGGLHTIVSYNSVIKKSSQTHDLDCFTHRAEPIPYNQYTFKQTHFSTLILGKIKSTILKNEYVFAKA